MEAQICMLSANAREDRGTIAALERQRETYLEKISDLTHELAQARRNVIDAGTTIKSLKSDLESTKARFATLQGTCKALKEACRHHHEKLRVEFSELKIWAASQKAVEVHGVDTAASAAEKTQAQVLFELTGCLLANVLKAWEVLGMDVVSRGVALDAMVTVDQKGHARIWSEDSLQSYRKNGLDSENITDPCSRLPVIGQYTLYPKRNDLLPCTTQCRGSALALVEAARGMGLTENVGVNSLIDALDIPRFGANGPEMSVLPQALVDSPRSDLGSDDLPSTPATPRWRADGQQFPRGLMDSPRTGPGSNDLPSTPATPGGRD